MYVCMYVCVCIYIYIYIYHDIMKLYHNIFLRRGFGALKLKCTRSTILDSACRQQHQSIRTGGNSKTITQQTSIEQRIYNHI